MKKSKEAIMEIAYSLMDFYPGLDLTDALSFARRDHVSLIKTCYLIQ